MALLHYQNLETGDPGALMRHAFFGLKTFYDFLRRTRDYMESDAAVKRLAWTLVPRAKEDRGEEGVWVQLTEPDDRPNEPDATFQDFLSELVTELYEAPTPSEARDPSRATRLDFRYGRRINVLDRDPERLRLLLERQPQEKELLLRPNTWPLQCQIRAIQTLQNAPCAEHRPLLRLLEPVNRTGWPDVPYEHADLEWMVLTDSGRPGTDEQRQFVQLALDTPDLAFLEGPPGSGKTTTICELVLQLVRQGKRVLLCASTHVAVDNVLERLMDARNAHRELVIPVRVGDQRKVSPKAQVWQLERFVHTERERLLQELRRVEVLSNAQRALRLSLEPGTTMIERLVLSASNLVCGTTIGILQHPDIKNGTYGIPSFDVLIVDEASKTTFQEFLVPALLARRWVLVGDPRQLSPYVDEAAMSINVASCLPSVEHQDACIDTFIAGRPHRRQQQTIVSAVSAAGLDAYRAQAQAREVELATPDDHDAILATAPLIVGSLDVLAVREEVLPLDVSVVRAPEGALALTRRRAAAWNRRRSVEAPSWAREVGWRLTSLYAQRFADDEGGDARTTTQRLREELESLLPDASTGCDGEQVWSEIDRVRRVALPSVLEALQCGSTRDPRQRVGTALSDGLDQTALEQRHVLLRTQHRMHGDIAAFSHEHIYKGGALYTPTHMATRREWGYARYAHRALWLDVRGCFDTSRQSNHKEAIVVIEELQHFDSWAQQHPRGDGQPWEVAVLTFYRGQEREIREQLRRWTGVRDATQHFWRGSRSAPHLSIDLCTIDRFQGHEADLVLISVARTHPTSFLESPNRLNVALTRARFQRVIIGHRTGMYDARARGMGAPPRSLLAALAETESWSSAEVRS